MNIRSKSVPGRIDGLTHDDLRVLESLINLIDAFPHLDFQTVGAEQLGQWRQGLQDIIVRSSEKPVPNVRR
jgi:hypothetical protein